VARLRPNNASRLLTVFLCASPPLANVVAIRRWPRLCPFAVICEFAGSSNTNN
jgi:hypothetical protein